MAGGAEDGLPDVVAEGDGEFRLVLHRPDRHVGIGTVDQAIDAGKLGLDLELTGRAGAGRAIRWQSVQLTPAMARS